jgi:hypothetical protein
MARLHFAAREKGANFWCSISGVFTTKRHPLLLELGIVAVLIVINGLLAMSELAIVSSRPARRLS